MAQSVRDFDKSFTADNIIAPNLVVKATSTGTNTVDVSTANGDAIIGVSQNNVTAAAGDQVSVRMFGTAKCIASGVITAGQTVTATTGGKVVADSTDTHGILGRALETSAADGDIIEVLIQPSVL